MHLGETDSPDNPGFGIPMYDRAGGKLNYYGQDVSIDPSKMANASRKTGIPVDWNTVLIHEMAHMFGNTIMSELHFNVESSCNDTNGCPVAIENEYRASVDLPLRQP